MLNRKKRAFQRQAAGVIGAMAAMLLLSACGGGQKEATNTPNASPGDTKPGAAEKPPEPLTLTIFSASGGTADALNAQYGEAIKRKFPHMTVEFIIPVQGTSLREVIAAKTPVDLLFGATAIYHSTMQEFGLQVDLADLIKKKGLDLNKVEPSLLETQRKLGNGALYGLPVWVATSGLFYNKDLFDKFSVPYPKDNMVWSDVTALAQRLTRMEGGEQYYGYVTSPSTQVNSNQLSLDPIDPKALTSNLSSDSWKRVMQSIVDLYTVPGYDVETATMAASRQRTLFEKEMRVAMYTNFSGGTPPETMNWDVVTVPYFEEAKEAGPQPITNYWYVTSLSKQQEAAFDVIAFLMSEEFQSEHNRKGWATVLNNSDLRKQYGQDLEKFRGKNIQAMFPKPAAPMNMTAYNNLAATAFQTAFNEIVSKKKDMNTALRDADEQLNKAIRDAQGK
jgi:multiple sugar transport system substrate-binding protein